MPNENKEAKQVIDNFFYNTQRKRKLSFIYMFAMKKTVIYTVCVIAYVYFVNSLSLFKIAIIVGGYYVIHKRYYPYTIENKEELWFFELWWDYVHGEDQEIREKR